MKNEGAALPPFPSRGQLGQSKAAFSGRVVRDAGGLRCEMCGAAVLAAHCKRICLRCGFMTGCSEGL